MEPNRAIVTYVALIIPIVGMMVLLFYFTYLAFREMRKNDQLIAQGKHDEVLKEMQE